LWLYSNGKAGQYIRQGSSLCLWEDGVACHGAGGQPSSSAQARPKSESLDSSAQRAFRRYSTGADSGCRLNCRRVFEFAL